MTFRDHADAMRVIGATFAGHALFEQPSQSWMVRRVMVPETGEALPPATTDVVTSSAYHFVVTWLPGRALIITGDIGSTMYCGITHLSSLDDTVRLVREADFDYLARKSTHKREYDADATCREIVEHAYSVARQYRDFDWFRPIIEWADLPIDTSTGAELVASNRKEACRALLDAGLDEHTVYDEFTDVDIRTPWDIRTSWPAAAHWHYEALRTWGGLMARASAKAKLAVAREQAAQRTEASREAQSK